MGLRGYIKEWIESVSHVLFVVFAFVIMVLLSYSYSSDLVREQLEKEAQYALLTTESHIEADLQEPETTLGVISDTVRQMIINGEDIEVILRYITNINEYLIFNADMMPHAVGVYGLFDCFDNLFFAGNGWIPPDDYNYRERPWYLAALEANGGIGVTDPYLNMMAEDDTMTYARRIFDDTGAALGTVCIDINMERINEHTISTEIFDNSYVILMNKDLEVIAHPDPRFIGMSIYMMNDGEAIADSILSGSISGSYDTESYLGERSTLFYRRLDKGWYLGIITPYEEFYKSLRDMAWYIGLVGSGLGLILCVIIIQTNRAKNKANQRTQVMLNSLPMCTEFWSKDVKLLDCNQEALRFYDLTTKQEYFDRYGDLSPKYQPDGKKSTDKGWEMLMEAFDKGYCRFEFMHQNLKGDPLPCEVTFVRVKIKDDYIVAGYIRDLREQKDMIAKLGNEQTQRTMAEAANNAKTSFLATMSHEIRTPMNAILGITEIQLQNEMMAPDVQEGLIKIHDAGYTLLHIINDMLDLSKIEAGKMEVRPVKYDVASLINDTISLNIMRLGSKPIDFKLELDENTPTHLIGDELRIKQILNNLLSNAFKYTDRGVISLEVTASVDADEKTAELKLRISDTGQGMSTEQIGEIYDEYSRFSDDEKLSVEGVGLGMTIVQRLVSLMDGKITVESELGVGTSFDLRFIQGYDGDGPIGKEAVSRLRNFSFHGRLVKGTDLVREHMPYGSVLLVDDVDTNLYVAKGFLAPYSLTIDTAISGYEAIDKIQGGNVYDIIFMDHMMPKMDGMEATRIIREMGYKNPIVALTANALVGRAQMFLANGFDDFVSKPIDVRQLNVCLNKYVRDRQPPAVIEAARQSKEQAGAPTAATLLATDAAGLWEIFMEDAKRAVQTLEKVAADGFQKADMSLYVTTVHGMKNALMNVGEAELSRMSLQLENAGRRDDVELIKAENAAYISGLSAVIIKAEEQGETDASIEDDKELLQRSMHMIKAACEAYDRKGAKDVLNDLQQKKWSPPTKEKIKQIAGHILHGYFEEAAKLAEEDGIIERHG